MALFKSQLVTQASGSVGGITFTRTRSGMTLRARSMPVNPNTEYQQRMRSIQSTLAQAWQSTLTDLQRAGWETYAANVPRRNKLGDTIHLTGNTMFIRCNSPRLQADLPLAADAPAEFTLGDPVPEPLSQVKLGATNSIEFVWTPAILPATSQVLVYVSRPVGVTRNFFKGPFRFQGKAAGNLAEFIGDSAMLPLPIHTGDKVFVRWRVTYDDGRLSDDVITNMITQGDVPGSDPDL